MKWLNRFSLIQLTLLSACVLFVFLLFLVGKDVSRTMERASRAEADQHLITLLDALEKVAHNHAVERGLTAGFLGAKTPAAKEKVDTQREKADQSELYLKTKLKEAWPEVYEVPEKVAILLKLFDQKASLRSEVDNLNGKNAFKFYSKLNKAALDAAANLTLNIYSSEVTAELTNALQLARLKERLGQVRGKTNGVLARQSIDETALYEINFYQDDIGYISNMLNQFLVGNNKAEFKQAAGSANMALMQRVVDALQADNPNFSSLPSPADWFGAATGQIGEIKAILDKQWQIIDEQAATNATQAEVTLITLIVVTLIIIVVVVFLYSAVVKLLRSQLNQLGTKLDQIATHGDLTVEVRLDSQNELGIISHHVHKMMMGLRDLMVGLKTSMEASDRLSVELSDSTKVVLADADETQKRAIEISSAIEEMAMTSQEISRSTNETLDASQALKKIADHSLSANQNIKTAMSGLSTDMRSAAEKAQTMGEQMSEISGILNTINTLTEQTNLLALNAAIEAARAGEHGRGFAVVADEVRQLATASRASTDKISTLLESLTQASDAVINSINESAERTASSLEITEQGSKAAQDVMRGAEQVEMLSNTMATATEQQSITARQIAENILSVQEAATQEHRLAQELDVLAQDLRKNNEVLQNTMSHFKVS